MKFGSWENKLIKEYEINFWEVEFKWSHHRIDLQTQTLNKIITDLYNYMILGSERIKLVKEAKRIDQCTTGYVNWWEKFLNARCLILNSVAFQ